jgi:hypothetical protein
MCTTNEKFFTPLSASEYRLLDILCSLSKQSVCEATMAELSRFAQCSEESIRRALRGLEVAELVSVERTKRNFGKLYRNRYFLISPSHKNVDENPVIHKNEDDVIHKNVGSTHDYSYSNDINNNKEIKTTSLFMFEPEHKKKVKEIVLRGWQDDDAELAGFGLFDDEVPASKQPEKVSKRSSKTRSLRPQEDWTALDVAAEFASRVYAKLPGAMNVVNTVQLQKILSKNRKQFNLTPIIELEVMRLFFEDNWFRASARTFPHYVQGRFLKFFSSHLHVALSNLGLDSDLSLTEAQAMSEKTPEFVYASDGTRFDNSMPGRYDLMEYEEKLRSNDPAIN